ncbi:MAG: carboxypeptidase regulatory-like domain-containing protein [Methanomassiliicoccales archaeon]|nr:carboxypeptidase regulatory-like domain-containing protein [Methanomassiliicoccales archaeon]
MRHWQTVLVLVLILILAVFVRTYFAYDLTVDNGYLVSGGSDSYYHERVIDYVSSTGDHLVHDPLLNYPFGMRNPRLPLYDWSVAVSGMLSSAITGSSVQAGTGYMLDLSTAFWGTLTVIPVFLIGRMAFGNKSGLVAALLFAIMAGHIERSVFSNADHDAMMLFFAMFAFFFLLMALSTVKGDRWVKAYRKPREALGGISSYIKMNQVSLIYAMLGGVSMAAVSFAWEGYMYLIIILLIYFLVQILINRFKNIDSLGVFMALGVMLATFFVLAAPVYWQLDLWGTWFDMPMLLSLGMLVVGLIFVVTRDYPWTLVLPTFVALVLVALAVLSVVAPNVFEAIITGQGYLVKSKLYSTISEAQAPAFSTLALSFGVVTFWLAIVGLVWAAIKIPKNLSPYFVFIVVWMGAAIFMAMSAGRFVFNAAPVFAISAAWIVVLIIQAMKFEEMPKALSGIRLRNPIPALRKGIKIRHVLGVFFLAVLIILPNAWTAIDAGIPTQTKRQYDLQVYDHLPQFLRPSNYDSINGSYWYFGAFSYSLPLPTEYYPAAWSWFAQKDASITPVVERPAYLSWWDYGFESIQAGQHPTVADNFQNGYQFAGSFITCTNETQAIAMFVSLAIQGEGSNKAQVDAILSSYGVDVATVNDAIAHPSKYISVVMSNPQIYGSYDMANTPESAKNALYVFLRVELSSIGKANLVSLYNELRAVTGVDVGYFAIDSRLFPFSATGNNIFYAPAKLSDHFIDPVTGAPTDFYQIWAVDSNGNLVAIQDITSEMIIVNYVIIYTDAFYETMLYRAFMGFGPADLGLTDQGLPGISGSLAGYAPMQGWNMSNFRLVYKTSYFNPFPASTVANHSDAWQAIGYDQAVSIQAAINAGTMTGVVDTSAPTLENGVVFLQYYDGAIVRGQATAQNGNPYPGVFVTVLDQYGIPHQTTKTDVNGNYEVIAPFGTVNVVFTIGAFNNRTQLGATELGRESLSITYDQAMRKGDYIFDRNVVLASSTISGRVYWNLAGSSSFSSATDQTIGGAEVILRNTTTGYSINTTTAADGTYSLSGVPPMNAEVYAVVDGHSTNVTAVTIQPLVDKTLDIGISPASISGRLQHPDGTAAPSFELNLSDLVNGSKMAGTTASDGSFDFGMLLPGEYQLESSLSNKSLGIQIFNLVQGQTVNRTFTLYDAMTVSGQILTQAQLPAANITVGLISQKFSYYLQTDAEGRYSITMPSDNYTLISIAILNSREYAAMTNVPAAIGQVHVDQTLQPAGIVAGRAVGTFGLEPQVRFQSRTTGAVYYAKANVSGYFGAMLPIDNYFVYIDAVNSAYWADVYVRGDMSLTLNMVSSSDIYGVVWYDANGNGLIDTSERIANVPLAVSDADGRMITVTTASDGSYRATLVSGREYTTSLDLTGYVPQSFSVTLGSSSITHDFKLIPYNRTVSGTVAYQSSSLSGVTVTFTATTGSGAQTATAVTDGLGRFSLSLHPGTYTVVIAENTTLGSNATQYQYMASLTVGVGSDPAPLTIQVARRVLVSVTITSPSTQSKTVVISGPDSSTRQTSVNFTVYLQPGTYSVYAYQERFAQRYASLASYDVSAPSTIAITMSSAFQVTGDLTYSGARFSNIASITVANLAGGTYKFSSLTSGTFSVVLPGGDFNISAETRLKQDIALHTSRYVRYTGYQDVSLASNIAIHIPLSRSLDNATVVGQALLDGAGVSASLVLTASSDTAINATISASASGYNFTVAPGNYSVYARQTGGTGAFLGLLTVEPYVTNYVNLTLADGLPFSGSTTVNGIGTSATMQISNGNVYTTTTAADGSFLVYLPPGTYQISATAHASELGVAATYTSEFILNLTGPVSRTIALSKVASYGVDLQWDSSQKQTINAGESVTYTVRVVNTGNVADSFALTVSGATSGWTISLSQTRVNLGYGSSNSQLVTVTIVSPANAKVSHQTLSVRATSLTSAAATDSVTLDVGIAARYGAALDYNKASSTSGGTFSYSLNVTNSGNVDDTFNVTVVNTAELAQLGWKAEVRTGSGSFASYFTVTVSAGSKASFDLRLTQIRSNPDPQVTVVLTATSKASPSTVATLPFVPALPKFTVPSNGMSVTGNGVVQTVPNLPGSTLVLVGLVIAMFTILLMVALQKGVLRRRKR